MTATVKTFDYQGDVIGMFSHPTLERALAHIVLHNLAYSGQRGSNIQRVAIKTTVGDGLNISAMNGRDGEHAGTFHAIFETTAGLDYCREDAPDTVTTITQAVTWANELFERTADTTARAGVTAFRIEQW